jgi:hypothetical protein
MWVGKVARIGSQVGKKREIRIRESGEQGAFGRPRPRCVHHMNVKYEHGS